MLRQSLLNLLDSPETTSVPQSLQAPTAIQVLLSLCSFSSETASKAGNIARLALANAVGMAADETESVIWLSHLPKGQHVSERWAEIQSPLKTTANLQLDSLLLTKFTCTLEKGFHAIGGIVAWQY